MHFVSVSRKTGGPDITSSEEQAASTLRYSVGFDKPTVGDVLRRLAHYAIGISFLLDPMRLG